MEEHQITSRSSKSENVHVRTRKLDINDMFGRFVVCESQTKYAFENFTNRGECTDQSDERKYDKIQTPVWHLVLALSVIAYVLVRAHTGALNAN